MLQNKDGAKKLDAPVAEVKTWSDLGTEVIKALKESYKLADTWTQLNGLSADFVKSTGIGRERSIEMETSIAKSATEVLKFSKGIYSYEDALKRASEIVTDISQQTHKSLIGNEKEIQGIALAMEATGVPTKDLVKGFKEAGFSLEKIPVEMKKVTDYTRSIGVNTAEVSGAVVANLKNLNSYNFENGIQGLTKMVAQSALFGIDMSRMFAMSEELFNPERAIDMAASLQRLGVSTSALLDPLKLMDMGQNNPQELQNQIVEMTKKFTYFDEKNQKFQILPGAQREMREIADVMKIPIGQLQQMALGSSELSKKMGEIRFPTLSTGPMTEEQKQMIANMSEMRGGEYKVMVEQKNDQGFRTGVMEEKSITQLSDKDIETLSESSKPKALEDLAKEQLTALNRIANAVTSTVNAPKAGAFASAPVQLGRRTAYNTLSKTADQGGTILSSKEISEAITKLTPKIIQFGEVLAKGGDVSKIGDDIMKDVATGGQELFDRIMKIGGNVGDIFKNEFTNFGKGVSTLNTATPATSQQVQSQEPTGSFMKQLGLAFDKVSQGVVGTSQAANNSQVNNLNNQTVNATTNNQQSSMGQSNYLTDVMSKALPPQIVEHKFDGAITIKVDAPPGVDTAYVTKTVKDTVNKLFKDEKNMADNFGITTVKVGELRNTSGDGLG